MINIVWLIIACVVGCGLFVLGFYIVGNWGMEEYKEYVEKLRKGETTDRYEVYRMKND